MTGAMRSPMQRSRQPRRSRSSNCFAVALRWRKAAPTLAISRLSTSTRPCSGVRYSVVWLARLAALPTAASSSGRQGNSLQPARGVRPAAVPAPPLADQCTGARHGLAAVEVLRGEAAQRRLVHQPVEGVLGIRPTAVQLRHGLQRKGHTHSRSPSCTLGPARSSCNCQPSTRRSRAMPPRMRWRTMITHLTCSCRAAGPRPSGGPGCPLGSRRGGRPAAAPPPARDDAPACAGTPGRGRRDRCHTAPSRRPLHRARRGLRCRGGGTWPGGAGAGATRRRARHPAARAGLVRPLARRRHRCHGTAAGHGAALLLGRAAGSTSGRIHGFTTVGRVIDEAHTAPALCTAAPRRARLTG